MAMNDTALEPVGSERKWKYIVSNSEVCGGVPHIFGTRLPVWGLENARRKGFSDQQIIRMYPPLRKQHLAEAWQYVEAHRAEIEKLIRENEA